MSFDVVKTLRERIAKATGENFVGYNALSLVTLVPHAQLPGNEQISPVSPGTLIVRRGQNGEVIGTGIVEGSQRALRRASDLIGVTRLGILDPAQAGRFAEWKPEDVSSPTADELIALLVPRS